MQNPLYLNAGDQSVELYLRRFWLSEGEKVIHVEKTGEGNMNLVLRIVTDKRNFILKQARPWVEKYPQIVAPQGRILVEARYYELIQGNQFLQSLSPSLLYKDSQNFILLLEDLGVGGDCTTVYERNRFLEPENLLILIRYLSELHHAVNKQTADELILNPEMRLLNHQHLFLLPFDHKNGFNVDAVQQGLHELSLPYKNDVELKEVITQVGDIYLATGDVLLHGDFYPGSWLRTAKGINVIDPEFCFFGPREFDVAVMLAHLKLSGHPADVVKAILANYSGVLNRRLLFRFAGVEIMRRILGIAQLPLALHLAEKKQLLQEAYILVMQPEVVAQNV